MQPTNTNYRIGNAEFSLMLLYALFWDAVSLIPIIGTIIAIVFGGGGLMMWWALRGVKLMSPKAFANWTINGLAEAIPALSTFWIGYTVAVILMFAFTRIEDKTGVELPTPGKAGPTSMGQNLRKVGGALSASNENQQKSVDGITREEAA